VTRPIALLGLLGHDVISATPGPRFTLVHGLVFAVGVVWLALALLRLRLEGMKSRHLIAPVDVIAVPVVLILIEPDLGTSLIVVLIAGAQVLYAGMRPRSILIGAGVSVGVCTLAWHFLLKDYQRRRIETFLDPEHDLLGAGYHATQSMIAVGSGQLTGKGYSAGTQTQLSFLPENHTDFVFSVLSEEQGFVGASFVIVLFLLLVLLILDGARDATDKLTALVAVGAAALVFSHVLINVGMVSGLLPVVGVTLPFFSYGGSSMVTQLAALGLATHAGGARRAG
jgi:rod shape determining protein RodA